MTTIRDLLRPLTSAARSAAQHATLAAELRALADEQQALSEALKRDQVRPPAQRLAPTSRQGRGGGPKARAWLRIERHARARAQADELRVKFARSIYYAAERPARLDPQLLDGRLVFVAARGDVGYKVIVNVGGVWINASGARDLIGLADGRYTAELAAGTIIVGAPIK